METYISIEKNKNPIFYIPSRFWNQELELKLQNKGYKYRKVFDIHNEGLVIDSNVYRMIMKKKPKIGVVKRCILIVKTSFDLDVLLLTL